jgi:hypothetical protein
MASRWRDSHATSLTELTNSSRLRERRYQNTLGQKYLSGRPVHHLQRNNAEYVDTDAMQSRDNDKEMLTP